MRRWWVPPRPKDWQPLPALLRQEHLPGLPLRSRQESQQESRQQVVAH